MVQTSKQYYLDLIDGKVRSNMQYELPEEVATDKTYGITGGERIDYLTPTDGGATDNTKVITLPTVVDQLPPATIPPAQLPPAPVEKPKTSLLLPLLVAGAFLLT